MTREERTEIRRKYTKIHRREYFLDKIKEFAKKGVTKSVNQYIELKCSGTSNNIVKQGEMQYVFISDIHFDKNVQKGLIDAISKIDSTKPYTLILVGDNISGTLRISDYFNNDFTVLGQISVLAELLSKSLNKKGLPEKVVVLRGNHDEIRLTQGLYGEHNPSFSDVLCTYLIAKGLPESIVECRSEFEFKIGSEKYLVIHGHQFRSIKKLRQYYENEGITVIHGHFHTYEVIDGFISLPPFCDEGDYSKSLGYKWKGRAMFIIKNNDTFLYIKI